jgi:2,3-bisphosphoglycerate-independent phosphoglycerate mutase
LDLQGIRLKINGVHMTDNSDLGTKITPLTLMILDGWGSRDDAPDNAISQANTPCWDKMISVGNHTTILTSGESVGLPAGQMGNSEVGHMNIGAGRVVYQDYTRISQAVEDGSLRSNPALGKAIEASRDNKATLHIMGLLSAGGVHSHQDHFLAMVQMAAEQGAFNIVVHAFLDGRDTPPRSAGPSIAKMQQRLDKYDNACFGTVCGRYFAMDRDKRWDRVQQAWNALVEGKAEFISPDANSALESAYAREQNDEFVSPTLINGYSGVKDNDSVIFVNFRSDRAREISQAFTQADFPGFARRAPKLSAYVCMTQYLEGLPVSVAFPPESLQGLLGESLASHGLKQLRIAETEKYAHVTFFFNGGEETPFPGEQRLLVPSPDVATYDLQPEMSVEKLAAELDKAIRANEFDVVICNVANTDMVGHTGNMVAAIAAVEAVDACLARVYEATKSVGGELLITADHGNAEQMSDHQTGQNHTAHTTNPVPFVYIGRPAEIISGGALKDIAPTMLYLLGITPPSEMTGHSLLKLDNAET